MLATRWSLGAAALLLACGTNDASQPAGGGSGGTSGTGGSAAGGTGAGTGGGSGDASLGGGSGGNAGSGGSGLGGSATGGSGGTSGNGGSAGAGNSGGYVDFWPAPYDPNCAPATSSPDSHAAYTKMICQDCHSAGGDAGPGNEFLIGGVIWEQGGLVGAAHREVGIRDGTNFIYACTDARGFFWAPVAGNTEPNWPAAEHRIRGPLGEKLMPDPTKQAGTCNGPLCHADPKQYLWVD